LCSEETSSIQPFSLGSSLLKRGDNRRLDLGLGSAAFDDFCTLGIAREDPWEVYSKVPILGGQGSFGKVQVAYRKDNKSDKIYAVKSVERKGGEKKINRLLTEIEIMKAISHPNIPRLYEVYEYNSEVSLVMDYCPGVDLLTYINSRSWIHGETIQEIFGELMLTLKHLHSKKIAHLDIKPENIMIDPENNKIMIIDFGLSSRNFRNKGSILGTLEYMAPEALAGKPSRQSDIWSAGITLFQALTKELPFRNSVNCDIIEDIGNGVIDYSKLPLVMPEHCKDFLTQILVTDPKKRLRPKEALTHPFLKSFLQRKIDEWRRVAEDDEIRMISQTKVISNIQEFILDCVLNLPRRIESKVEALYMCQAVEMFSLSQLRAKAICLSLELGKIQLPAWIESPDALKSNFLRMGYHINLGILFSKICNCKGEVKKIDHFTEHIGRSMQKNDFESIL